MTDKYIEALAQGINSFYAQRRLSPSDRQMKLFLHLGQSHPETISELAVSIAAPKSTVYEDLRALGGGSDTKRGACLIEEIPPVKTGLPIHYRPSKKGQKLLEDIAMTMHLAMDSVEGTALLDESDPDGPMGDWMASRDNVRG